MKTTHRPYAESVGDFNLLCGFVIDHAADVRRYSTWCLGRVVDWRYGLFPRKTAVPDFCGSNCELWFDGFGRLCGVAISESGDAGFAIITLPGYRFLYEDMLVWSLGAWGDRPPRPSTEITAAQEREAAALERYGFVQEQAFLTRSFDLAGSLPERPELPDGFRVVDMGAHPDYRAQRIMRADAFGGRQESTEEQLRHELLFFNHAQQGPIYHAPADICVMAPDGSMVAGCEALIDAANLEADIERVCTHSSYRRRGFARAAIVECMHRLAALGIERAYITGYSEGAIGLYGSLGHQGESTAYVYEKR